MTARDFINQIADPELKNRVLTNAIPFLIDVEEKNLIKAIKGGFVYEFTPEGVEFWQAVEKAYFNYLVFKNTPAPQFEDFTHLLKAA